MGKPGYLSLLLQFVAELVYVEKYDTGPDIEKLLLVQ